MDVEQVIANAQAEVAERSPIVSGHPTEAQLWAYLHDALDREGRGRIGAHLGTCPDCRSTLRSWRNALADLEILLPAHLSEPPLEHRAAPWTDEGIFRWTARKLMPIVELRRWAWHAAAFAVGGSALIGLNSYLQTAFAPEPSPFGSPPPTPWWAESWAPYAVGAWAGVLALHGLVVWRQRHR